MFQSRDQVRQIYLDVWEKVKQQALLEPMEAIIADVIQLHPEYYPLLNNDEEALTREYTPEQGETNPFLHMGMHIGIREQANTDRPAGIRDVYQKLSNKYDLHDAEHAIMECLAEALWRSQKDNVPFDEVSYLENLSTL